MKPFHSPAAVYRLCLELCTILMIFSASSTSESIPSMSNLMSEKVLPRCCYLDELYWLALLSLSTLQINVGLHSWFLFCGTSTLTKHHYSESAFLLMHLEVIELRKPIEKVLSFNIKSMRADLLPGKSSDDRSMMDVILSHHSLSSLTAKLKAFLGCSYP